jgi:signal peptidase I
MEIIMVSEDRGGSSKKSSGRRRTLRGWVALIGAVLATAWFLGSFALTASTLRAYVIPTSSMAPAIKPGDRVCVEVGSRRAPVRGEIWAIRMPKTPAPGTLAIKRIVGLPGETVEISGGKVVVDGRPLAEPYLSVAPTYIMAPLTLGPDEFFLLGDNRNASHDSHVWGPAGRDRLVGRVALRYWPPSRLGGP